MTSCIPSLSLRVMNFSPNAAHVDAALSESAADAHTVAAVSAAINAFNKDLLVQHLHTCVVRDLRQGDDAAVDELAELVKKLMK